MFPRTMDYEPAAQDQEPKRVKLEEKIRATEPSAEEAALRATSLGGRGAKARRAGRSKRNPTGTPRSCGSSTRQTRPGRGTFSPRAGTIATRWDEVPPGRASRNDGARS